MNQIYYTPTKAAQYLGVSRRTIYNWMDRNNLPYQITPSGRRLILISDVLKYSWNKNSLVIVERIGIKNDN